MVTIGEALITITEAEPGCPYCGQIDPEPATHMARVHDQPREPEWVRRAREGRLPVSDRTGQVAA